MLLPLLCIFAFLSGVFIATLLSFNIVPVFLFAFGFFITGKKHVAIFVALFLFGVLRVHIYETQKPEYVPYGNYIETRGKIVNEIDMRMDVQKIAIDTEYGRVLINISPYEVFHFGDEVSVRGVIDAPSNDIDGFNYAGYLARYRIWSVMKNPNVELIESPGFSMRGNLYFIKGIMEKRLNKIFFEPEASFAAGLLLGSRKGMPPILADAFQAVGLTHIVAISGYNISLVIAVIFLLLGFLPLKARVIASSVSIFLFVILVGASAAVVRAGIMGSLTLWGLFSGRKSQAFFGLLWSMVLMSVMNPYTLVFDVGFQLSFASTFGLLIFSPILEDFVPQFGRAKILREAFLLTLSAQITTLPLILFHFGRLSLISVLANVIVAPFLPPAMLFSALALVFGKWVGAVAWFYLRVVESSAILFAKIPFSNVALALSWKGFLVMYLLIFFFAFRFYKSKLERAFLSDYVEAFSHEESQECERHGI